MKKQNLLQGKRILIVDDEADVLDTLVDLLTMCKTDTASTFEDAEKKIAAVNYDMAILDIMGVDGYKLLDLATDRKITAIMLTAHALSPADTLKSHQKGAAYFLPKEEMINLEEHLLDVLEAEEKGRSAWDRWFDKFASFYERKFGPDWQDPDKDYWDKFKNFY